MFDANRDDLVIGVVGAGLMGRGIAQIAAVAGIDVVLFDARDGAAAEAKSAVGQTLAMLADKGRLSIEAAASATRRIVAAAALADFSRCQVVIEAIVENLEAKRELFSNLEGVVAHDCVLATNTSSLSVTSIAAVCQRPQRVAGFHFFSPVPLMKIVEVIDGVLGASSVGDALTVLAQRTAMFRCAPGIRPASSSITHDHAGDGARRPTRGVAADRRALSPGHDHIHTAATTLTATRRHRCSMPASTAACARRSDVMRENLPVFAPTTWRPR